MEGRELYVGTDKITSLRFRKVAMGVLADQFTFKLQVVSTACMISEEPTSRVIMENLAREQVDMVKTAKTKVSWFQSVQKSTKLKIPQNLVETSQIYPFMKKCPI